MTTTQLAEAYFLWLEPQTRDEHGNPNRTYRELLGIMHSKEFETFVTRDDNRTADGLELRREFCYQQDIPPDSLDDLGPCTFLEVLVGLSRRLEFQAGRTAPSWAWELISNLELHHMGDPMSRRKARQADAILDNVIHRRYRPDGGGGFFPLHTPLEDQTQVELWYQMSAFVREIHPEHYGRRGA